MTRGFCITCAAAKQTVGSEGRRLSWGSYQEEDEWCDRRDRMHTCSGSFCSMETTLPMICRPFRGSE